MAQTGQEYLRRSWDELTSDRSWWRVILLLGLVNCVPLVGQVFVIGFLFDWSKEAAWNMHRSLPHKLSGLSHHFKYGFIWLAVTLVWVLPLVIIGLLLGLVPKAGSALTFLFEVLAFIALIVSTPAALRAVIYEHVGPGLQFGRVLHMVAKDPAGLFRIMCIGFINVGIGIAGLIIVMIPAIPFIAVVMSASGASLATVNVPLLIILGMLSIVVSLIVWVAGAVCSTGVLALYGRALGLWMSQFEPASWGSPRDPMAFEVEAKRQAEEKKAAKAQAKAERKQSKQASAPEQAGLQTAQPDGVPQPPAQAAENTETK